ncbi:hypothetical protein CVT26_013683 [Gymnopilus dilepis]|uniref:Uncharacterized protein n=1 Tax=Gymnopilus dilepis TaxID=231916 RepID=A0A409YWI8_9AGAR|nr:hypothetical protein CVT26_013683 [Gymnopilus dilepis]
MSSPTSNPRPLGNVVVYEVPEDAPNVPSNSSSATPRPDSPPTLLPPSPNSRLRDLIIYGMPNDPANVPNGRASMALWSHPDLLICPGDPNSGYYIVYCDGFFLCLSPGQFENYAMSCFGYIEAVYLPNWERAVGYYSPYYFARRRRLELDLIPPPPLYAPRDDRSPPPPPPSAISRLPGDGGAEGNAAPLPASPASSISSLLEYIEAAPVAPAAVGHVQSLQPGTLLGRMSPTSSLVVEGSPTPSLQSSPLFIPGSLPSSPAAILRALSAAELGSPIHLSDSEHDGSDAGSRQASDDSDDDAVSRRKGKARARTPDSDEGLDSDDEGSDGGRRQAYIDSDGDTVIPVRKGKKAKNPYVITSVKRIKLNSLAATRVIRRRIIVHDSSSSGEESGNQCSLPFYPRSLSPSLEVEPESSNSIRRRAARSSAERRLADLQAMPSRDRVVDLPSPEVSLAALDAASDGSLSSRETTPAPPVTSPSPATTPVAGPSRTSSPVANAFAGPSNPAPIHAPSPAHSNASTSSYQWDELTPEQDRLAAELLERLRREAVNTLD